MAESELSFTNKGMYYFKPILTKKSQSHMALFWWAYCPWLPEKWKNIIPHISQKLTPPLCTFWVVNMAALRRTVAYNYVLVLLKFSIFLPWMSKSVLALSCVTFDFHKCGLSFTMWPKYQQTKKITQKFTPVFKLGKVEIWQFFLDLAMFEDQPWPFVGRNIWLWIAY